MLKDHQPRGAYCADAARSASPGRTRPQRGSILTSATLEPKAHTSSKPTSSSSHRSNGQAPNQTEGKEPHGHARHPHLDAAAAAAASQEIPASQIHIDPATGLPFLENIHFNDFNISAVLKERLAAAGFKTPTPVQAKAIPPALEGADILATASTGTGKTLSFLIPMIDRLEEISKPSTKAHKESILALILLPTRELAMQVLEAYAKLIPGLKNDSVLVCGGLSENTQLDQLSRGPRLVVATPGRLEDFLRRNAGSGRGGPHAGYGLPARDQADCGCASEGPPDDVLLGHAGCEHPRDCARLCV
jgi:ATP-dependent RNA helicase RhlE